MSFYQAGLAFERERKMEELASIVEQSPDLSSVEILRLAAKSGLVDNPNMSAILKQKIQEEQGLKQAQQTQEGVNLRSDLFGTPQPAPEEQAQSDIGQITGGQPPSLMSQLSGGGPNVGLQQKDFSLAPPEQPQDVMSRLQVEPPIDPMINERRKELLDAGFTSSNIDQMVSDLQVGNMSMADFDNEVAKALTARTKKKEAATKAEALRLKEGADRLRQAQKEFVIYNKKTNQPAETIDYNNPDNYLVSQERRSKLPTTSIVKHEGGGRGAAEAEATKLLRDYVKQRTSLVKEQGRLRTKMDLDPRVLEAEGLNKEMVEKQFNENKKLLESYNNTIGELQGTIDTKKGNQEVPIPEPPKPTRDYDYYYKELSGKPGVDPKSLDKFLRQKFGRGLYN